MAQGYSERVFFIELNAEELEYVKNLVELEDVEEGGLAEDLLEALQEAIDADLEED